MDTSPPDLEEFKELLRDELTRIPSNSRRKFIEDKLIEPYQVTLNWEYGSDEPFQAWVFADMERRDVVAQYCRGGFGALGAPWGINIRYATHFGTDSGWFPSIEILLVDEGVEA